MERIKPVFARIVIGASLWNTLRPATAHVRVRPDASSEESPVNKPVDLPMPVIGRQKMTPSEAFVETLVAHGVKNVFGIVGSAYMDALDLFPLAGIRFISVAHEQGGGHMADGYSRVSGRHGVCIAQNGPGITNFVTSVAAAYWAHSPVVCITPETGSMTLGLGGFQETEQLPIFSKITKYQAHVNNKGRMAELTSRAFDRALLEMGPTQLNIPRDFFYGDIECEVPRPIAIERGAGGERSLDEAADLLASAQFPVIIAGGGIVMGDTQADAIALAELLHAPVACSYLHNDTFPSKHPLWCGPLGYQGSKAAMKLLAKADVVLALGTRLGPFGTLPQHGLDYWPKQAKVVQVDADPKMLGLVKPISVGICADAGAAARALVARLSGKTLASQATARLAPRRSTTRSARGNPSSTAGRTRRTRGRSTYRAIRRRCIRGRCCARWSARCPRARWCRRTSATSARCRTATCASTVRARCSRR